MCEGLEPHFKESLPTEESEENSGMSHNEANDDSCSFLNPRKTDEVIPNLIKLQKHQIKDESQITAGSLAVYKQRKGTVPTDGFDIDTDEPRNYIAKSGKKLKVEKTKDVNFETAMFMMMKAWSNEQKVTICIGDENLVVKFNSQDQITRHTEGHGIYIEKLLKVTQNPIQTNKQQPLFSSDDTSPKTSTLAHGTYISTPQAFANEVDAPDDGRKEGCYKNKTIENKTHELAIKDNGVDGTCKSTISLESRYEQSEPMDLTLQNTNKVLINNIKKDPNEVETFYISSDEEEIPANEQWAVDRGKNMTQTNNNQSNGKDEHGKGTTTCTAD